MKKNKFKDYNKKHSIDQDKALKSMLKLYKETPIVDGDILDNLGLFFNSKTLSRILFMNELYKMNLENEGVIMEFGTRWGQNLSIFNALRGIYEPYNIKRKIIAFDTFEGFPKINKYDGKILKKGDLKVPKNYLNYLDKILKNQEKFNPVSHIKKYELIKGDGPKKLKEYFKKNPQTIVSLVFFDFDVYEPTKECLKIIKPHITKGSIIAFDELNDDISPGETVALKKIFNLNKIKLKKNQHTTRISYFILE